MSSAIEVLKHLISRESRYINDDDNWGKYHKENVVALGEGLLALEKQEKLKAWLEKEIRGKKMLKVHLKYQALEIIETEIKVLDEVLGELQ